MLLLKEPALDHQLTQLTESLENVTDFFSSSSAPGPPGHIFLQL